MYIDVEVLVLKPNEKKSLPERKAYSVLIQNRSDGSIIIGSRDKVGIYLYPRSSVSIDFKEESDISQIMLYNPNNFSVEIAVMMLR